MYILEGNIGVGKSTFLSLVKKHCPHIDVLTEPKDDWNKAVGGQTLLANFYADTSRWAYTMETFTMICRVRDHIKEQSSKNINRILERSIYSGHYCFAKNGFNNGTISDLEWDIYNQWVDFLLHGHCHPPLGFIYLQADPESCFARVRKRNRSTETKLSLEYMKQIHDLHDDFLVYKNGVSKQLEATPVLILNCNEEFEKNGKKLQEHLNKLQDFLLETQSRTKDSANQTQQAQKL